MTKRNTRRALLMSALSLVLCMSMLIGSTFAWFTDSVTSSGNIIKSGTLDVEMYWADGTETVPADDSEDWKDASTGAIFDYEKWEPGYTEVRHIKISNEGSLALKYQLSIIANGEVSKLTDAIDVYYSDPATQVVDRTALTDDNKLGTLTEVLAAFDTTASGELEADEVDTVTLALKMREEAGNEYQNLAIGSDFSVQLLATQLTSEFDSFNNQYDVNAPKTEVATAADLQKVLDEGGYAVLTANIVAEGNKRFTIPANSYAVIDLNGYTLTSMDGGNGNTMAIYVDKGAVFTLNDSVGTGKIVSSCYGVYVKQNANFIMNGGTISVSGNGVYDMGVCLWNSDFVMNGGTIESQFGVWVSNYYRDFAGETGLNANYVKIADGCTLDSTGYADVEYADALDAVIDVPTDVTVYPSNSDSNAVTNFEELKAALAEGKTEINIAGEITLTEGLTANNVTFVGEGENAAISFAGHNITGSGEITYKNLNLSTVSLPNDGTNGERYGWYGGIDYAHHSVSNYENCTISTVFTTYSETVNITGCTFNPYIQDGEEFYHIFVYGSKKVNVKDSTFYYQDRAIKIYNEGGSKDIVLNVSDSTFLAADDAAVNKALINVDTTYMNSVELNVSNITVDSALSGVDIHNGDGNSKVTVNM